MHLNKFEKCFLLHACKEELAYRKKQLEKTKQDKEPFIQNGINISVVTVELKIEEMENLIEKIRHE